MSTTPTPRNLRTDDSLSAELSIGIWTGGQRISGKIICVSAPTDYGHNPTPHRY